MTLSTTDSSVHNTSMASHMDFEISTPEDLSNIPRHTNSALRPDLDLLYRPRTGSPSDLLKTWKQPAPTPRSAVDGMKGSIKVSDFQTLSAWIFYSRAPRGLQALMSWLGWPCPGSLTWSAQQYFNHGLASSSNIVKRLTRRVQPQQALVLHFRLVTRSDTDRFIYMHDF